MKEVVERIILNLVAKVSTPRSTGRPLTNPKLILEAIDYILRTGAPWRSIKETKYEVHYSTVHKTFKLWVTNKVFEKAYRTLLHLYAVKRRRGALHYCIDSTLIKNQYGRDCLGRNPTDRGRKGTKLSALTDDTGIPFALAFFGANVSDFDTVNETFKSKMHPLCKRRTLYADKGYDANHIREFVKQQNLKPRIAKRGTKTPKSDVSPRANIENLFAWLDKQRRLVMRFDASIAVYMSFTLLACSKIIAGRL